MRIIQPLELDKIRQELINHKVEYIEVIEELTDHIANGIEQQWSESNTQVSFEEALDKELNIIGKKGLKKIQSEIYLSKSKEYILSLINALKSYCTSSALIIILAICLSLYTLLSIATISPLINSGVNTIILGVFATSNGILVYDSIQVYLKNKDKNRLLLSETYFIVVCIISLYTYLFVFHIDLSSLNNYGYSFVNLGYAAKSALYTLIFVLQYSTFYTLKPKYLKEKDALSKHYNL